MVTKVVTGLLSILLICLNGAVYGQETGQCYIHAIIHTGDGNRIDDGYIAFRKGVIVGVGSGNPSGEAATFQQTDKSGLHIYPGLFCLNTEMGLNEVDAIRATRDFAETGQFNPNARTLIAFNTDSKILPTALVNGITYVQAVPLGGTISGTSSIMTTNGWNWEDAVAVADDGIHVNWPETSPWGDQTKQQERMQKEVQQLNEFFAAAKQYAGMTNPGTINLRLASMKGLFSGSMRLYIHVTNADAIVRAIHFAGQWKIMYPVLVGAEEAYKVASYIKEKNIPVIVNLTHRLPKYAHEDVDLPYKLPALLMKEGIMVAVGNSGSWESRNVMFQAGNAVAYGLTREQAVQSITGNAARITGSNAGILETGKVATFILATGDILDMRSNAMQEVWISGIRADLKEKDMQRALYDRYRRKYGIEK